MGKIRSLLSNGQCFTKDSAILNDEQHYSRELNWNTTGSFILQTKLNALFILVACMASGVFQERESLIRRHGLDTPQSFPAY